MKPLKILHVVSHNKIQAGGSIQMMRLALGLHQMGHEVCCAFNIKGGDNPPGLGTFTPLIDAGINVRSIPMQRINKYYGMISFRNYLTSHRFDIIHAHRFRALNFVCKATFGLKIPALVGNKKNSFEVSRLEAKTYGSKKVDSIVVNAGIIKDLLLKTGRIVPGKVEIIYNGVDLDVFHPGVSGNKVRCSFAIDKNVPVFGMVANFARKKSHDVFFDAALKVIKNMPDVKFFLAGGGDYKKFQSRMTAAGFGDNFIFAGFRTNIPEIIAALDFAVISSAKGEGLTGSLVEAMAMAKPVISTDVAGNSEVVRQMETGLLVPPGDADAMADSMLFYLRSRQEAEKIGRNACSFIRDKVDNKIRSKHFEDMYYSILAEKKAAQKDNIFAGES